MKAEFCTTQLYNACHVLFGPEVDVSADFLRYLRMSGLKAVYRKKALETHPDRAIALDCRPVDLEEQFKKVSAAYRDLHEYLKNPFRLKSVTARSQNVTGWPTRKMHARSRTQTKHAESPLEGCKQHFFKGTVPKRVLLLGQYIYYQGLISYRQLIDAIVWQKIQRPLTGDIAVCWEWLYEDDVSQILKQRLWGEKFGESALRGGYLTVDELRIILRRQRILQPRIGKYFIEKKILSFSFIEKMAEGLRHHNRQYNSP